MTLAIFVCNLNGTSCSLGPDAEDVSKLCSAEKPLTLIEGDRDYGRDEAILVLMGARSVMGTTCGSPESTSSVIFAILNPYELSPLIERILAV